MNIKILYMILILSVISITIPTSFVFAKEFTMFGNTFEENSECAKWGLTWFEEKSKNFYSLKAIEAHLKIAEKYCDPTNP